MKLLLDECVPRRLKHDFKGHEVQTVDEIGLKGILDGELLRIATEQQFAVLITVDRRLPLQQNLSQLKLALIVLVAFTLPLQQSEIARTQSAYSSNQD